MADRTVGDLAIVLHSHMPYVEGFGTYPFGEEWLFDAFARSHLPVLDVADRLTMTITPVLADQLEAEGVGERILRFLRRHRVDAADRDVADAGAALRPAAKAEADHFTEAMKRLRKLGGNPLRAFQDAHAKGRIALMASAATHAVLPKLATLAGRRLQVDAGLRSHERRFGEPAGFWLPECAYVNGLEAVLAERGIAYTCLDQSSQESGTAALVPIALAGGPRALHDRLAHRAARLVRRRLPGRRRVPRVPPSLAQRDAALVDRRDALRPGGGSQAGDGARRLLPRRCARSPRASSRRARRTGPLRVRRSTRSCSATGGRRARSGCARC